MMLKTPTRLAINAGVSFASTVVYQDTGHHNAIGNQQHLYWYEELVLSQVNANSAVD
jgi:hypothetical protein